MVDSKENASNSVVIADLQLLLASIMFGFGFVVQRAAMVDGLGPLTFNALRYVVSSILMMSFIPFWMQRKSKDEKSNSTNDLEQLLDNTGNHVAPSPSSSRNDISNKSSKLSGYFWFMNPMILINYLPPKYSIHVWSALLGIMNFAASTLGQIGIQYVSASASAFITGFYVVFTPVLIYLVPSLGEKPRTKTWLAVLGSMLGLFIISDSSYNDIRLGHGEILTLLSALFWSLHIFVTEKAVQSHDAVELTMNEMNVLAVGCSIFAILLEEKEWEFTHLLSNWVAIVAMGLMECIGFTLSALGQMHAPPAHVALILATEAVFATIGGFTFLHESFTTSESIGCLLMMASMLIAKSDEYMGSTDDAKSKQ